MKKLCKDGGFRLTSFVSNKWEVIETIPINDHAKANKSLNLKEDLPAERALGVQWDVKNDTIGFWILKDKPMTKKGILAVVSSIYDPLGFASPFLLHGKRILQSLCKDNSH